MRYHTLLLWGALAVTCLPGVSFGQITWELVPGKESPVHDWAKYGERDYHPQGFTYLGHGGWSRTYVGRLPTAHYTTWHGPALPFPLWYGYGPSENSRPAGSMSTAPNRFGEVSRSFALPDADKSAPRRAAAPPSKLSPQAAEKIERLIAAGDEQFARQKYAAASQRYQSAAQISRTSAEAHFRHGFALIAQGSYRQASAAFRHGLVLQSDWSQSPFQLAQLYAPGALEKVNARLDSKLVDNPVDGPLLAAIGMQRYFSGNRERAAIYLAQAGQLGALDLATLAVFLRKPAEGQAAAVER